MKINDNKIVDGLMPDGSYQDRVDVQGQERAGTGIMANTFNQIIREFQDNYILKAGIIPLSDDLGQLYKATQYFINQSLEPAVASLSSEIASLQEEILATRALRIGEIAPWAGTIDTIPENAYLCDGALALIEDHQLCFKRIGHSWSNEKTAPSGYFYLPDGRGVGLIGAGTSVGFNINSTRPICGTREQTGIINITGRLEGGYSNTRAGAFKLYGNGSGLGSGTGFYRKVFSFDTSLVVPKADTNRDNSIAVNWIIYVTV